MRLEIRYLLEMESFVQSGDLVQIDTTAPTISDMTNPQFFTYTPNRALNSGIHVVEVMARDRTGNQTDRKWNFTVALAARTRAPIEGQPITNPANILGINRIETNAAGDLQLGDTVTIPAR